MVQSGTIIESLDSKSAYVLKRIRSVFRIRLEAYTF